MSEKSENFSRRDFLKIAGATTASGMIPENIGPEDERIDPREKMHNFLKEYNVVIAGEKDFSDEELHDICFAIRRYADFLGEQAVREIKITFKRLKEEDILPDENYIVDDLAGRYSYGGLILMGERERLNNSLVEKDKKGIIPVGERGADHRWTLIHELAHLLSDRIIDDSGKTLLDEFKIEDWGGDMDRFIFKDGKLEFAGNDNPSWFLTEWKNLQDGISAQLKNSLKVKVINIVNKVPGIKFKPRGYSTLYGSPGNAPVYPEGKASLTEIFAETVAYILTHSHHLDTDELFMKRINLIKELFEKIRKGEIKIKNDN